MQSHLPHSNWCLNVEITGLLRKGDCGKVPHDTATAIDEAISAETHFHSLKGILEKKKKSFLCKMTYRECLSTEDRDTSIH